MKVILALCLLGVASAAVVKYVSSPYSYGAYPYTFPFTTGHLPYNAGVIPNTAGVIPYTAGVIPNTAGAIPYTAGVIPNTAGAIPYTAGVIPNTAGIIPYTAGVIPNTANVLPYTAGIIPYTGAVRSTYAFPSVYSVPLQYKPIETKVVHPGYVAKTPGSTHIAPLPAGLGYASHHINVAPAPGTE